MIDKALDLIVRKLNESLKVAFSSTDDLAVLSSIADKDGKRPAVTDNKLSIFVCNIAQQVNSRAVTSTADGGARLVERSTPIFLNVDFLVASNFAPDRYVQSLKVLSATIEFFQRYPVFNASTSPDIPAALNGMTVEMITMPPEHLNQLWAILGSSYLPSVQYRLRSVSIDSGAITDTLPVITKPRKSIWSRL